MRLTLFLEHGDYAPFEAGELVTVYGGVTDGHAEMPGTLRLTENKRQVVVVASETGVVRQRRSFWRLPLRPKIIPAEIQHSSGTVTHDQPITLHNLSGGGIMFSCPLRLDVGTFIQPTFLLDTVVVRPVAKVLAVTNDGPVEGDDEPEFGYRAMFTTIRESERDSIIKFVTMRQQTFIELRKFPRQSVSLPPLLANVILATGERSKTFVTRVIDLSGGGMMFETDRILEPADRIRVYFQPGDIDGIIPVVSVLCEVPKDRPSQTTRYRGFFVEITTRERRHVLKLIEHEKQFQAVSWDPERRNSLRIVV